MKTTTNNVSDDEKCIALFSSGKLRIVRQHEIIYLQSDNCYTNIYLADNSCYMMCKTLKHYETELNRQLFLRCHRSFLVNRFFIKEIIRERTACVTLMNGDIIPVSRRKSRQLVWLLRMYMNNTVYPVKHTVP
jgi:two-component system LytT family response regulator